MQREQAPGQATDVADAEVAAIAATARGEAIAGAVGGGAWVGAAGRLDPSARARLAGALQRRAGNQAVAQLARAAVLARAPTAAPPLDETEQIARDLSLAGQGSNALSDAVAKRALEWIEKTDVHSHANVFDKVVPRSALYELRRAAVSAQLKRPEFVRMSIQAELMRDSQSVAAFEIENRKELSALTEIERQVLYVRLGGFGMTPELRAVRETDGYKGLTQAEQDRLTAMLDSGLSFSDSQDTELDKLLKDKKADKTKPDALRKWMKKQAGLPHHVRRPGGIQEYVSYRNVKVTGPTDAGKVKMESGKFEANKYEATFDGMTIAIFEPKTLPDKATLGELPTVSEVVGYIDRLPTAVGAQITKVQLNAKGNPADAYWAKQKGTKTFQSFMTAGADGVVSIYPVKNKVGPDHANISIAHETGHVVSMKAWGSNTWSKAWMKWREAMKKDVVSASAYAKTGVLDDFAESWALWVTARGTPHAPSVRALIPNRVELMEPLAAAGDKKADDASKAAAKAATP